MIDTLPILNISIWQIAKIFVLFCLGLYLVFAYVIIRQVQLMINTLEMGSEDLIKTLALTHFFFALGVFILALIIL